MAIIAEFVIPPEALPGGETLAALSSATVRLERIIPADGDLRPIFWVSGVDPDRFVDHARSETGIGDLHELTRLDHDVLYMAVWTPEQPVVEGIKTLRATILDAVGTADRWVFQVRAEERSRLQEFMDIFTDNGIPVELRRISSLGDDATEGSALTPKQRQTLLAAYEMGYYDRPRSAQQDTIGSRFGISGRAVSNRLRRGTRNLIESTLVDPAGSRIVDRPERPDSDRGRDA